jgi:L-ascorbate metabolism protein UlaG (beta-lactamase superfamily)
MMRWLGVAGLEFTLDGHTLLVDPMFSRPSTWQLLALRGVASNQALVASRVRQVDHVLVTHAHYDHLLDVPEVLRLTGARAFGSRNTCDLLAAHDLPADRIVHIRVGDRLMLDPFAVEVFPAQHTSTPLDRWINGPLPSRIAARLPLRLMDYRMDVNYSFRIHAHGLTILVGNYPVPADVLFIAPYHSPAALAKILGAVSPRLVVPIHWDNFMRPLSQPLRSMLVTPFQGWSGWPPLRRLSLEVFARQIKQIQPGVQVLLPEIFKEQVLDL